MNVRLISIPTFDADALCGYAARVCTNSDTTNGKALKGAMSSGHESIAEHATFTFLIEGISRVTLAQLTRHRIASYSVQSQRYCRVQKEGIIPESVPEDLREEAVEQMHRSIDFYESLISHGMPQEDARYFLPEGTPTTLILTMNCRELRHFFSLRCCNRAQWEIRELAMSMHHICKKTAPGLFEKAGPACVRGNCPEGKRTCGRPWKE